jgi:hypothetical protein
VNAQLTRADRASDHILALVCGLPEPIRSNRLFLMLKAYIDDSRMGQEPIYVLAGWVAPAKVWGSFSDAWDDVLRMSPRIEYFKFAEAMNFNGQFAGISTELRDEKMRLLVKTIECHSLLGISFGVPHYIFLTLFARHPNPEVHNPYFLAFYALIGRLVEHYAKLGSEEKIEFAFDYQPTGNSMRLVRDAWQRFLNKCPPEWRHLLPNHEPSFLDDKDVVALQAADLHAGWVRMMNERPLRGQEHPIPPWAPAGDSIKRLYRYITEENVDSIHQFMFGFKPVRFSYVWGRRSGSSWIG